MPYVPRHIYYRHGSFEQHGTKNRSRYQWPRPRGGESSFVISSTIEGFSVRKGHGDLIADDRFLCVCQWAIGCSRSQKKEEKSAIKQKCHMTEEVNVRGPRVDWKDRRQEWEKDSDKLQKTGWGAEALKSCTRRANLLFEILVRYISAVCNPGVKGKNSVGILWIFFLLYL